jgi:uncharacterized protein (DUF2141 family)
MRIRVQLLALLMLAWSAAPAGANVLKLQLQGLKPQGQVLVMLFDAEQAWKAKAGAVREIRKRVSSAASEISVEGLRPGRYGVMAFQDLNLDGKMNFNAVGWPLEPYGFSNNSRGLFGPPAWGRAAFRFGDETAVHSIRLR